MDNPNDAVDEAQEGPTFEDLLRALSNHEPSDSPIPDRLELRQGSPGEYGVVIVRTPGGEEERSVMRLEV